MPEFLSGLKLLAQAGLVLETANPDAALIAAVVEVSDRVPDLRIVLDHLPHAQAPTDESARAGYEANLMRAIAPPENLCQGIGDCEAYRWARFSRRRILQGRP